MKTWFENAVNAIGVLLIIAIIIGILSFGWLIGVVLAVAGLGGLFLLLLAHSIYESFRPKPKDLNPPHPKQS